MAPPAAAAAGRPARRARPTHKALRALGGILAAVVLLLSVQVSTSGPAAAHSRLQTSVPAAGASVAVAPDAITLTFDEPVSVTYSHVTVTGPGADRGMWQTGPLSSLNKTATQALRPLGGAGVYRVAWRVVSVDGHPVTGTFEFTLSTAGTGIAAAAERTVAPVSAAAEGLSGSAAAPRAAAEPLAVGRLPLVAGLVTGSLLLAAAALAARRPRRTREEAFDRA